MIKADPDLLANPSFKSFIDAFSKIRQSSEKVSLDESRKLIANFFLSSNSKPEGVHQIKNVYIDSPDKNKILVRFFIPSTSSNLPVRIYFHRGGWVFRSVEEADPKCRKLANHLNLNVFLR